MFNWFKTPFLLIRFSVNTIEVINLDTKERIKRKSLEAFSDKRLVIADFLKVEKFLKTIIEELIPKRFGIQPSLKVIIQQIERNEGGISPVEIRAYQDSCEHAWAKEVYIINQETIMLENEILELFNSSSLTFIKKKN